MKAADGGERRLAMRAIVLSQDLADEIIQHAKDEAPNECCGVLLGKGDAVSEVRRARNVKASPVEYELDPKEHVDILRGADEGGLDVVGFYHSHTFSQAYPSITDISKMSDWGYFYLIASLADATAPVVRAFWFLGHHLADAESRVEEVTIRTG